MDRQVSLKVLSSTYGLGEPGTLCLRVQVSSFPFLGRDGARGEPGRPAISTPALPGDSGPRMFKN